MYSEADPKKKIGHYTEVSGGSLDIVVDISLDM